MIQKFILLISIKQFQVLQLPDYKYQNLRILQIFFMKEIEQKSGSPSPPSNNAKKTTVEREFYVCFCAKSYNSYSALYLHAKKKHDQNLTMKCLKFKKHEWSGNVKNIYYEFVEEDFSDQAEEVEEQQSMEISLPIKKSNKESPKLQQELNKTGNSVKNFEKLKIEQKLIAPFEKYIEEKKNEENPQLRAGLISNNYEQIGRDLNLKEFCSQGNLDIIPHAMNNFFTQYYPTNTYNQQEIIKELACFSDWLYSHSYSKYLAVAAFSYEKFQQTKGIAKKNSF